MKKTDEKNIKKENLEKESKAMNVSEKSNIEQLKTESIFKENDEKEVKVTKKAAVNTKLIANMNKRIERELGLNKKNNIPQSNNGIDKYISYKQEKRVFQVQFSSCSREGELSTFDEEPGLYIVMSAKATGEGFPYFEASLSKKMLTYIFDVKVVDIDEALRRVYVASSHDAKLSAAGRKRNIEKTLINAIEEKSYPTVWGKIRKVYDDKAIVDLFGMNISGVVLVSHWSKGYVRSLKTVCDEGEFYQFQVTYVRKRVKNKPLQFLLDRRNFSEDPWKSIPKDLFAVGTIIEVKCIDLPINKSFWWGTSELTPGIEIMGDFPSSMERKVRIFQGMSYMCKVDEVSIDKEGKRNCFKVVPFDVSENCKEAYRKLIEHLSERESKINSTEE